MSLTAEAKQWAWSKVPFSCWLNRASLAERYFCHHRRRRHHHYHHHHHQYGNNDIVDGDDDDDNDVDNDNDDDVIVTVKGAVVEGFPVCSLRPELTAPRTVTQQGSNTTVASTVTQQRQQSHNVNSHTTTSTVTQCQQPHNVNSHTATSTVSRCKHITEVRLVSA